MKIKKKLKVVKESDSKKENNTKVPVEMRRIYVELGKTDFYSFAVEVPVNENATKENSTAIMAAWNVINKKLIDTESVRIGDGFQTKILKKELVKPLEKKE